MPSVNYSIGQEVGKDVNTGEWYVGSFRNSGLDFAFGTYFGGVSPTLFFLFPGVTIPDGATITVAYITWQYRYKVGTPPACTLKFEDAANPDVVSSEADGNSRTPTTASVSITGPSSGTYWNSPDLSAIIQGLMNSNSYASGANMQCFVYGAGAAGNLSASWDSVITLHIEYTEAAAGGSLVIPPRSRRFNALLVR